MRDFLDRGFRTSNQVETMLGLPCIALVPLQKKPEKSTESQPAPNIVGLGAGLISHGIASSAVEQPFSRFAEAIRTIKLAAELNGIVAANKVVGITSTIPDEGKSTIAAALALSIAQVGGRAVLVDCDLRNPSLSRAIAPGANVGILEVLSGQVVLDEALNKETYLSLAFLPLFSKVRIADSSELLSSTATKRLFERLRNSFDYVIVDLPPLAPLADVRATTHLVDSYLLVVEWGRTSTSIVQHALSRAPRVSDKVLGTVLNKVDMKALSLYDGNRALYYHNKAYGRYGYTD
jgi:polysaccharide biosynthesis transport protein